MDKICCHPKDKIVTDTAGYMYYSPEGAEDTYETVLVCTLCGEYLEDQAGKDKLVQLCGYNAQLYKNPILWINKIKNIRFEVTLDKNNRIKYNTNIK